MQMRRLLWVASLSVGALLIFAACQPIQPMAEEAASGGGEAAAMTGNAEAGAYLVTLNGCGCHFNRDQGALSGGNKFEGDFGVVYASNLTPDDTGLADWTEADIAVALRTGLGPDGEVLAPSMPYGFFGNVLTEQDALDIGAYLLSLDPVANELPENEVTAEFEAAEAKDVAPAADAVARGAFLAAWSGCGRCHNPTNEDGSPKPDMMLAGGRQVGEELSANITPDEETGIGTWTEEQIATYMTTGTLPDGSQVEGAMGNQINNRFSKLSADDAAAIAAYLKSIPAVSNAVGE